MKRIAYILGIAALGLTACQSEELAPVSPMEPASGVETRANMRTSFKAVFADDAITRTQLVDGRKVSWTAGDEIMVIPSNVDFTDVYDYSKASTFSTTQNGSKVDFEGSIVEEDYYCAVYPSSAYNWIASMDATSHNQAICMTIPATQKATPNSFAEDLNIAYAHSETMNGETTLVFENVCALIKFQLSGSNANNIRKVMIQPMADGDGNTPTLSGHIYIAGENGEVIDVRKDETNNHNYVVLDGIFDTSSDYYMVVPPVALSNGFRIIIFDENRIYIKYALNPVELKSNTILDLGTINVNNEKFHELVEQYYTSSKSKAVPFVVIPEGYTNEELSLYEENAKLMFDFIFKVEPYKTYKDYFNLYIMKIESAESGADVFNKGIYKNTYFSSGWDSNNYDNMRAADGVVFNFVISHCPDIQEEKVTIEQTPIIMLINDSRKAGICFTYSTGEGYAMVPIHGKQPLWGENSFWRRILDEPTTVGDWRNTALHEGAGHCFGRLGDEYWYDNSAKYQGDYIESHDWSVPHRLNLTLNEDNPPWSMMIPSQKGVVEPGKFPYVGVYEGSWNYGKGIWRSEEVTCMDDARAYFGAWQRYLIVKRIFDIVGEEFTYEKFLENDRQYQDIQNGVENAGKEGLITTTYNGLFPNYNVSYSPPNYVEKPLEAHHQY